MKLYHFTRRVTLPEILRDGLTKGYVPLDVDTGVHTVCLTVRANAPRCVYGHLGEKDDYNKSGVRIAVEIEPQDTALLRWKYFPERFEVNRRLFRALNVGQEGNPVYDWYIYFGAISAVRFLEVRDMFSDCPIPRTSWPVIESEPMPEQALSPPFRVLSLHEATRRSAA